MKRLKMMIPLVLSVILMGAAGPAGCVTAGTVTGLKPICDALSANAGNPGPIKYNTYKKLSLRYAGSALAPDLATRNQIGHQLHCPGF